VVIWKVLPLPFSRVWIRWSVAGLNISRQMGPREPKAFRRGLLKADSQVHGQAGRLKGGG
jgi:hypothetical protein